MEDLNVVHSKTRVSLSRRGLLAAGRSALHHPPHRVVGLAVRRPPATAAPALDPRGKTGTEAAAPLKLLTGLQVHPRPPAMESRGDHLVVDRKQPRSRMLKSAMGNIAITDAIGTTHAHVHTRKLLRRRRELGGIADPEARELPPVQVGRPCHGPRPRQSRTRVYLLGGKRPPSPLSRPGVWQR